MIEAVHALFQADVEGVFQYRLGAVVQVFADDPAAEDEGQVGPLCPFLAQVETVGESADAAAPAQGAVADEQEGVESFVGPDHVAGADGELTGFQAVFAAEQDFQQFDGGYVFVGHADGNAAQFRHGELGIEADADRAALCGKTEAADGLEVVLQAEHVGQVGGTGVQFAAGQGVAQLAGIGIAQLEATAFHVEVEGFGFQVRHAADFDGHSIATAGFGIISGVPHRGHYTAVRCDGKIVGRAGLAVKNVEYDWRPRCCLDSRNSE